MRCSEVKVTGSDCLFCGIVAGERSAHTVYADRHVLAFLDIRPMTRGHTLVVPRAHRGRLADVQATEGAAMFRAAQTVARAAISAIGAAGTTLLLSDGAVAGQEVAHAHLHVIPRYESSDLTFTVGAWETPPPHGDTLNATAALLAKVIA